MSKKPLTRAELKRLEQLQKQLELKESKLNARESKLKKQKKELESGQRQLATEKKQFNNEKKQFKQDKQATDKNSARNLKAGKQERPFSAQKSRKLKEDYAALKKKHEHFAKLMRDYKKKADQLEAENKVLKRRVENAANKKLPTNDKQLRGLMKENRWLKKKLRELMKDLAKQKRWYSRVVKVFKDNNNKWVQKKIEAYADKQYIIKYVFLDDIKRVVLTRKGHDRNGFKPRIRIRNGRGGSTVIRNVQVKVRDTKVRKRNRKGKRDRRNIKGDKGKNTKDVITKQRPGKDGKNIVKTKYVDKGDTDTITKQRPGKDGKGKGGKKGKGGGDDDDNDADGKKKRKKKKGGKGGDGDDDGDDDEEDDDVATPGGTKKKKKKKKKKGAEADAATSEFLKSGDVDGGDDDAKSPSSGQDDDGGDGNGGDGNGDGDDEEDDDDVDPNDPDYDPDDWEDVDDPDDKLDDYMVEFLGDLGIDVKKEELGTFEDKLPDGDVEDSDDDEAEAKLDKEFQDALKTDKDLMFDGDSGGGSAEFQAQIMYLINEMDSRNDDLNKLKDIVNGVQYLSKADSGGNEEEMEEKELPTPKDKLDAMALIFDSMQKRQDALLTALEGVNCDTDALRPINEQWYEQYHALAQIAITQGGGEATAKAEKSFEKLRYFVDYFMRELIGRMYDLRCVNAAHYNQGITFNEDGTPKDESESKDNNDEEEEDKPVFDTLQGGIDERHNGIQEAVNSDEVMKVEDFGDDKAGAAIQSCLTDFLGNIDDWKSLIQETRTKHETWIDTRTTLINALEVRHAEIGELMSKVKSVPSYSMNLQKYAPPDDGNETENEADNYGGSGAASADESGAE